MSRHYGRLGFLGLLLASAGWAGCGDDDKGGGDDRFAECDTVIKAGSDTEAIQEAFIEVETGQTICFEDGTYSLTRELSLTVADVTVQGNPEDREAVLLDYTGQEEGKDALSVSGDGFTIQHLSLKNSRGNTIVAQGVDGVTFRDLKVYWDAGSSTDNGAYAVYPLSARNVLVEDCEVIGASDAGIYVGQSSNIIVRNNVVHGNVAGIEIENSDDALVTGNTVYDNSAGILVFVLSNLEKKDGARAIVEDNDIRENNHENFGQPGTTVSYVPPGVGVLVLAADATEIRNNQITNNKSTGVLAVSFQTFSTICAANGGSNCGGGDPATDPYLSKLYIHGNTFENNGKSPDQLVSLLLGNDLQNVLWDGVKPESELDQDQLCLGEDPTSVNQFGDNDGFLEESITDPSLFTCTLPAPFESIDLPQDA